MYEPQLCFLNFYRFIISIGTLEIGHVYNLMLRVLDKHRKSSLPIPLTFFLYHPLSLGSPRVSINVNEYEPLFTLRPFLDENVYTVTINFCSTTGRHFTF